MPFRSAEARDEAVGAMIAIVVLAVAVYLMTTVGRWAFLHMSIDMNENAFTTSDYLKAYGLEAGKVQPLRLGGSITGTSGTVDGSSYSGGFVFLAQSSSMHADLHPTSTVDVGLQYGDERLIVHVPSEKIQFHVDDAATPSAVFMVDDAELGYTPRNYRIGSFWAYSPAHPLAHQAGIRTTTQWKSGPGSILAGEHLLSIRLTLSSEKYKEYLGSGPPGSKKR